MYRESRNGTTNYEWFKVMIQLNWLYLMEHIEQIL